MVVAQDDGTLPTWKLYERIHRRTGGLAHTGALSISLRLRDSVHNDLANPTPAFGMQPASVTLAYFNPNTGLPSCAAAPRYPRVFCHIPHDAVFPK
jgi:hypothetical protein